jgi:16S rRNA (guanine527-N7)-methyltransferase
LKIENENTNSAPFLAILNFQFYIFNSLSSSFDHSRFAMDNAYMHIDEARLRELVTIFLAENKKLNLSAFRTEELCWVGNVLDSVAFLQAFEKYPDLKDLKTIADIGTGGGFPLLPLALCLPEVTCTGIDSTQKKIDAVGRIVEAMSMKNVRLIADRMEVVAHQKEYRETFDLVTARALAPLNVLLEYAIPLLKVGGWCAFWKSTKVADELAGTASAQKILKTSFVGSFEYTLPGNWGDRTIVFFKKNAATSADYPRKTGIPTQKPL